MKALTGGKKQWLVPFLRDPSRTVCLTTACILVILLGLVSLVIGVAHNMAVQHELRHGGDAGALAGTPALFYLDGELARLQPLPAPAPGGPGLFMTSVTVPETGAENLAQGALAAKPALKGGPGGSSKGK